MNRDKLLYLPGDEDLVRTAPPHPASIFAGSSFSSHQPYPDYGDLGDTLRSIQEEPASLRACVAFEYAALCDFVQERHDDLKGMIASQT